MPSDEPKVRRRKLTDYKPLQENPNKGTARGMAVLEHSVRTSGAGRSLLSDKYDSLLAGNHTQEALLSAGIDEVIEIETTGNQVVVVKRSDLDAKTPEGMKIIINDNRTNELGLDWDEKVFIEMADSIESASGRSDIYMQDLKQQLADQLLDIDRDEQIEAVEKVKQPRDIDLIYTAGTINKSATEPPTTVLTHCCIAVKSGWLYGVQSTGSGGVCATALHQKAHHPQFIDNDYFNYDHKAHLDAVKLWEPKYCTVRDVMTPTQCAESGIKYYSLGQILDWAEELSEYAKNVIIIPKYDCLDEIPEKYMLGYSVPTSHGGTPLPIESFQGRRVHLLGGSPNKQIAYWQRIPDSVVSLDNNYILKIANYGNSWLADGNTYSLTDLGFGALTNPLYVALTITLGNMGAVFWKKGDEQAQIQEEQINAEQFD